MNGKTCCISFISRDFQLKKKIKKKKHDTKTVHKSFKLQGENKNSIYGLKANWLSIINKVMTNPGHKCCESK